MATENVKTLVGKRVRIIGDHPHQGASGTITKDPHRIMGGATMVVVTLDHGDYPGHGCGVGAENIQWLPEGSSDAA